MGNGTGSVKASFCQPGACRAADSENDRDALDEPRSSRDATRLRGRAEERLAAALEECQHGFTWEEGPYCLSQLRLDKGREQGRRREGRGRGAWQWADREGRGRGGGKGRWRAGKEQGVEREAAGRGRDARDRSGCRHSFVRPREDWVAVPTERSSAKAAFGEDSTGRGGETARGRLTAPRERGCSEGYQLQHRPPGR